MVAACSPAVAGEVLERPMMPCCLAARHSAPYVYVLQDSARVGSVNYSTRRKHDQFRFVSCVESAGIVAQITVVTELPQSQGSTAKGHAVLPSRVPGAILEAGERGQVRQRYEPDEAGGR